MKRTSDRRSSVFLIIGLVFIVISIGLSVFLLIKNHEYSLEADTIDDVKDQVVIMATDAVMPTGDVIVDATTGVEDPITPSIDSNLLRRVDFDELASINTDATRWLYIPDTTIDSYVMQEQTVGDYYYLWRDIHKKRNSSGSLLTPKVPLNADDPHLIIFGHRIFGYDSLAFSSLRLYFSDVDTASAYPYVYLYYPDRAERWAVWAVCDVRANDQLYEYPYELGSSRYEELLSHVADTARFQNCDTPDVWTETLFLSTCNGNNGGSDVRLAIACVPDAMYYYDTETLEFFTRFS